MATHHTTTDSQEDSELVDEHEDKPTSGRERKSIGRILLHSKAVQKMTGRKRGNNTNAVTPTMDKEQSPSRVSVTTSRRPSNTMSAVPAAAGREKPGKQQEEHYPIPPPPEQRDLSPQGPLFQSERPKPNTSPLVTSTAADEPVILLQPVAGRNTSGQLPKLNQPVGYGSNQPPQHLQPAAALTGRDSTTQSLAYDHLVPQRTTTAVPPDSDPHKPDHTHLEGEQEGDYCHDDPSVSSDQQVQLLELAMMRLKREKTAMENTMAEYEHKIVSKNQEIAHLKKAKTAPLHVASGVTDKETKLEMSLVDKTAQLTQCTAEKDLLQQGKDLLQQEFYELQAKYKALEAEKQTATHQVKTSTHQAETARKERASLEEEIIHLREQLVKVEREKKELVHSSQEQQLKERVKHLEDELRGIDAQRKASEEALTTQCRNNEEQLEQLLATAQEEVQLLKSKPVEQQLRHQLEESNEKVTVLEDTKRLVQKDLDKEKRKVAELTILKQENAEQRRTLEHDLDEVRKKVAEVTRNKEKDITEQRRKMETIKQDLATAQQELVKSTEKKEKYKTKLAETLHKQKVQELDQAMEEKTGNEENETRLQQQLAERNEETRKIKENYEIRLAELQRQLETRQHDEWALVDDSSQTTGGAGASPLTSLEDKRKTADLLEELTGKDQHLAGLMEDLRTRDILVTELREKLHQEELLSKQLGKGVSHLQSDLKKTSTAKDGLSEEVKILRATLAAKEAELCRMAEDSNEQIGSLADTEEQSSREVLRLREILKQRSSQLDNALQSLDRVTRAQQTLENEKAQLAHDLQEKERAIDSLHRRLNHKDIALKKERDEADKVEKELEEKLLEQVKERSELSAYFEGLKAQHVKLVELQAESDQALNTKQRQLESKEREVEELQTNLAITQAQAATYQEDFLQERRDREAKHEELQNLKDQSAAVINRTETRIAELEKELTQRATGVATAKLQEDYQISQSQIIAYKKQMDIGKKELEVERKKTEQKQSRIDGLNSQLRLLSTENVQLKRGASNSQMESTRADRLQNELEHMTTQNRELERMILQLKSSNQVLSARLQNKPQSHHSPQLDHTPPSGQHHVQPGAVNVKPQSEHGRWQQPNAQQVYQDQQEQLYRQQQQEQQRQEQEQLYRQQQQELQRREQEQLYRQQQQEQQRREQEQLYRQQQQEQQRREQEQLYRQQQQQPGAIPYSYEESTGRVGPPQQQQQPPTALPHRYQHGGRASYSDDMLFNTNAGPVSHSTDSLPSVMGQQYPSHRGGSRTSGHTWRPDQQPTPAQLGAMAGRGRGGGLGRDPVLHQSQLGQAQQKQQPSSSPQPAAYSSATAESSSKHNASDSSDVAENPLIEGIDKDMLEAQREVEKMYVEPAESIEGTAHDDSFQIPFDPLLICPKCGRQFRRGEIQKLRKHHDGCQQ